jgi:hypothetical protein
VAAINNPSDVRRHSANIARCYSLTEVVGRLRCM